MFGKKEFRQESEVLVSDETEIDGFYGGVLVESFDDTVGL